VRYPCVGETTTYGWPVFYGLQETPVGLLPHLLKDRRDCIVEILRHADLWELAGFHSNARYYREQARIYALDVYRMGVELGLIEEDEDLEEEIRSLIEVSNTRATT
jgi:hypothetical protein